MVSLTAPGVRLRFGNSPAKDKVGRRIRCVFRTKMTEVSGAT
jgi:hypothetical protein